MTEDEALNEHGLAQEYQDAGRHGDAVPLLERVSAYFAEADGPHSPDLANVLCDLADSCLALCRYDDAETSARRAAEILRQTREQFDDETRLMLVPRGLIAWGRTLRELGRYPEAETPIREAIQEIEALAGPDSPVAVDAWNELGILCKYWGRFEEGAAAYAKALEIQEEATGVESPETASLYHNIGGLAHARGDFAAGEAPARKAYEIRRAAYGEDDPRTVADAVAWGGLLDGLGRHDEAIPIYRRALAYYEARLGPDHFEVAATLHNLGFALAAAGAVAEGAAALERALAIKTALFAEGHPERVLTGECLARVRESLTANE